MLLFGFHLTEINTKEPDLITMEQLQARAIQPGNDTLYIINFWATWCAPCVKEIPFFEQSAKNFSDKKVKTIFVSLDFVKDKERVMKFVENKKIKEDVFLLNAGNPNIWIDQVDPSWSGAIPATIFYKSGKKLYFREGEFNQSELDSIIHLKIK